MERDNAVPVAGRDRIDIYATGMAPRLVPESPVDFAICSPKLVSEPFSRCGAEEKLILLPFCRTLTGHPQGN